MTLHRFQVQYPNIRAEKPLQPLAVLVRRRVRPGSVARRANVTVTAGLRVDAPMFKDTAFTNPSVDALTFRDQDGSAVQIQQRRAAEATPLWSPRVGFNWDVANDQKTQMRGGTGVFTGKPPTSGFRTRSAIPAC